MAQQVDIYGLDIETDTTDNGLDPAVSRVRTVALSGRRFDDLFVGDEAEVLAGLDARLASLPPGVIATWNGAKFDLPFLAERASFLGVGVGLCLRPERTGPRSRTHPGDTYLGRWHGHGHLDCARLYGTASPGGRLSLRALGRMVGWGTGGGPGGFALDLAHEALHACAPSDARLARVLAERRWPNAARLVDQVAHDEASTMSLGPAPLLPERLSQVVLHPSVTTA